MGKLVLPMDEALGLVPIVLEEDTDTATTSENIPVTSAVEIAVDGMTVRLPGNVVPERIAAIACALRRHG